ncbi:MAG: hypothetical protein WKG00_29680 [Polyangiaceae bacterium]
MTKVKSRMALALFSPFVLLGACGGDDGEGTGGSGASGSPGGTGASGASGQSGTIDVTISGEDAATDGFLFPRGSKVTFADGWQVVFDHVLVTVDNITISENPDKAPTDQSQTDAAVARVSGPWAVDLHRPGTVPGAGGEGLATPLVTIPNQNQNGGEPFATDTRYAFAYDLVVASEGAAKVNFAGDAGAEEAYAQMVTAGYAVYYVGTATFEGGAACETSDETYDFAALPTSVPFKLGFKTPTSYLNCQNQDNDGDAFADEEYQRGIAVPENQAATAQMTLHLEHAFYGDVEHEPAIWFTQMAAQLVGQPAGTAVMTEDLVGIDPTAITDGAGASLPWRVCDGSALPASDQMGFETGTVPVDPSKPAGEALRDYYDYTSYVLSTLGHLNGGEGLCYVKRNYPSPP